jgi:hypothetical protein
LRPIKVLQDKGLRLGTLVANRGNEVRPLRNSPSRAAGRTEYAFSLGSFPRCHAERGNEESSPALHPGS